MSIYGHCISHDEREATHAVVFKENRFQPANDRFGADSMTVAILDIVYCEECATAAADEANMTSASTCTTCDTCAGPALFHVSGNSEGNKCIGHVQKYQRGRIAKFYVIETLTPLTGRHASGGPHTT